MSPDTLILGGGALLASLIIGLLLADWLDSRFGGDPTQSSSATRVLPDWQRPPELVRPGESMVAMLVGAVPGVALLLAGRPILGLPLLLLILAAPLLLVRSRKGRWVKRLDEQVFQLIQQMEIKMKGGYNAYSALESLCVRSPDDPVALQNSLQPLAREIEQHLLQRLATEQGVLTFSDICRQLAASPRYAEAANMHQFLIHLASATGDSRLGPPQVAERLSELARVMTLARSINIDLDTRMSQARYTRWLVTAVVPVAAILVIRMAPQFGDHLLGHPLGQGTLVVAGLMALGTNLLGSRLARVRALKF